MRLNSHAPLVHGPFTAAVSCSIALLTEQRRHSFAHVSPASQISERSAFYASSGAGLAGLVLTALFLPDTTGLDLHEIDRMNRYLLASHFRNYHGKWAPTQFRHCRASAASACRAVGPRQSPGMHLNA